MLDSYRLFKYRILLPFLIRLVRLFFGKRRQAELQKQPFFILGSGRNGSTLLATVLNTNKHISIPPEQYVLPYAIMQWELNRFLSYEQFCDSLLQKITLKNQTSNWKLDTGGVKKKLLSLAADNRCVSSVYNVICSEYSEEKPRVWGDKTPLNTHFIEYIYPIFPKAKYIFLIRDVRDVVLSYSKMPEHPASKPDYAVWKWNDSIRTYDYLKQRGEVLLVKYEDFVSTPAEAIARIANFLNEDIVYSENKNVDSLGVEGQQHHLNLQKPISAVSVGRWKKHLPIEVLNEITPKVQKNLERFGYEL